MIFAAQSGQMQYLKILSVFLLVSVISCSPSRKLSKSPDTGLKKQIGEMITLLETGDLVKFIKTYAHPDDLEKILGEESIEEIAKDFSRKKAQLLLQSLTEALDDEPEFNEDKTRAVFKAVGTSRPVILESVGQQWYIRN